MPRGAQRTQPEGARSQQGCSHEEDQRSEQPNVRAFVGEDEDRTQQRCDHSEPREEHGCSAGRVFATEGDGDELTHRYHLAAVGESAIGHEVVPVSEELLLAFGVGRGDRGGSGSSWAGNRCSRRLEGRVEEERLRCGIGCVDAELNQWSQRGVVPRQRRATEQHVIAPRDPGIVDAGAVDEDAVGAPRIEDSKASVVDDEPGVDA